MKHPWLWLGIGTTVLVAGLLSGCRLCRRPGAAWAEPGPTNRPGPPIAAAPAQPRAPEPQTPPSPPPIVESAGTAGWGNVHLSALEPSNAVPRPAEPTAPERQPTAPLNETRTEPACRRWSFEAGPGRAPDYRWLIGELQYSAVRGVWRLRYAGADEDDRFGGCVTLLVAGPMTDLKNRQKVRVEGRLADPDSPDPSPAYHVESIRALP